jgi:hypothetical protein
LLNVFLLSSPPCFLLLPVGKGSSGVEQWSDPEFQSIAVQNSLGNHHILDQLLKCHRHAFDFIHINFPSCWQFVLFQFERKSRLNRCSACLRDVSSVANHDRICISPSARHSHTFSGESLRKQAIAISIRCISSASCSASIGVCGFGAGRITRWNLFILLQPTPSVFLTLALSLATACTRDPAQCSRVQ